MLLFFKKIKMQKKIRKIKIYKGTTCEKKEVKGLNSFWVTWSPSLHGDQAIENNKLIFTYK